MSRPIEFYVPGRPISQGSKTLGKTRDGRSFMREADDKHLRPWRKAVKQAGLDATAARGFPVPDAGPWFGPCAVSVVVTFGMRRPISHGNRPTMPTSKPDHDKLARAIYDALTGVLWDDDSRIVSATVRKVWAEWHVPWSEGAHVWANLARVPALR